MTGLIPSHVTIRPLFARPAGGPKPPPVTRSRAPCRVNTLFVPTMCTPPPLADSFSIVIVVGVPAGPVQLTTVMRSRTGSADAGPARLPAATAATRGRASRHASKRYAREKQWSSFDNPFPVEVDCSAATFAGQGVQERAGRIVTVLRQRLSVASFLRRRQHGLVVDRPSNATKSSIPSAHQAS